MKVCIFCGDPLFAAAKRGPDSRAHPACLRDAGFALDETPGRTPIGEPSCVVAAEFDQVDGPIAMEVG